MNPPSQQPSPENVPAGPLPEHTFMPQAAEQPPAPAVTAPTQPTLSASDVAAAIAAMPAPNAAAVSLPVPSAAADEDLIEPEWVNKTEQVIAETSGNPFAEEEAIEDLQIDYLQKRYGHVVKKPEDN